MGNSVSHPYKRIQLVLFKLAIGLVFLSLMGCATLLSGTTQNDFFGINIPDESLATKFVIKGYSDKGVDYDITLAGRDFLKWEVCQEWGLNQTQYEILVLKTENEKISDDEIAVKLEVSQEIIKKEWDSIPKSRLIKILDFCLENTKKSRPNPEITAWGKIDSLWIELTITNKSNNPISLNYFGDTYRLITTDGKTYIMRKPDILSYPKEFINPNRTVWFSLGMPERKENVKMIVCNLGVTPETKIILFPLPQKQCNIKK